MFGATQEGYELLLARSNSYAQSRAVFEMVKKNFIDIKSRLVVVQLNFYNPPADAFAANDVDYFMNL